MTLYLILGALELCQAEYSDLRVFLLMSFLTDLAVKIRKLLRLVQCLTTRPLSG
jgi:hypothetical protein